MEHIINNSDESRHMDTSPVPDGRAEAGMAYDSLRDMIVLFGGRYDWTSAAVYNDTWFYDYNTDTWTELFPTIAPSRRVAHHMVYDSESDRIILFGGYSGPNVDSGTLYNETWVGIPGIPGTWQLMSPAVAPQARVTHSMTYDSESDRVILFGGYPGVGTQSFYDTWAYDYNSDTWEDLTNLTNHPPRLSSHILEYDSESDRVVLFGGGSWSSTSDQTWLYDYNTNSWEQMNPTTSPSARCRHESAYDSKADRVIIYGGTTGPWKTGSNLINPSKTWAYDANTDNWVEVDKGETPPPFVPGYNLLFLIGSLSITTIIIRRKIKKS
jgi:hypothetical protein